MRSLGALPVAAALAGLVCALSGEAHAAGALLPSVATDQVPAIDDHSVKVVILRPAAAIGPGGRAIAIWQEWTHGINSSSYLFKGAGWSEPAMVTTETQGDNRVVRFDDAGTPVSYFYDNNAFSGERELKSELADGLWVISCLEHRDHARGREIGAERRRLSMLSCR